MPLTTPTFAQQNTTATNDMTADGYTWAAAKPIVVDQFGKVILIAQRENAGSKRNLFVVSNDNLATWTEPTRTSFADAAGELAIERGAMAYDSVNDLVHVLWKAVDAADGMIYRRYSITRDGSNNITGFTRVSGVNLQLDLQSAGSMVYEHPMIFWLSSGGANGQLLCIWSARNSSGVSQKNEIRASRRVLSNTTADNTAGNWVAPVSADTTGIGQSPAVAYSIVSQNNNGSIMYFAAGRKASGTNAGDIYVCFYDAAATPAYRFRRMRWNSGASDWSTGLSTTTLVSNAVLAGTDTGYTLKYQIQSQVSEDTASDGMFFGLCVWKDNTNADTICWFRVDSADAVGSRVDVYSAGIANVGSLIFYTLDLYFDAATARLVVVYQKTTRDFYLKTFTAAGTLDQGETAVYTGVDLDVPLIYPGRFQTTKLLVAFRDHVGGTPPYHGYAGTLTFAAAGGPLFYRRR